jgi:hypothetical protein
MAESERFTPDIVISMPSEFTAPANGQISYVRFLTAVPFSEDKWIAAEDAMEVGTRLCDAIPAQAWADIARWDFIWSPRRHGAASPADSAPGR